MKVLVSGASGLIGRALAASLAADGHSIARLTRPGRPSSGESVSWDPPKGVLDQTALAGLGPLDAVIHLAGESIAASRWTPERKREIRDSRVLGTRLLSEALARLPTAPPVLASASAVGYYGDRGDETLTEESARGTGFLADVCRDWEAAADPAAERGIRVVHCRTGLVLSPEGGILDKVLLPFKMGAGGPFGGGRQWMSWIALDDVVGAYRHVLAAGEISGAVNFTGPNPVRNAEFARVLGHVLSRPAIIPAPAFALRALFGEMADAAILAGQRALPARLQASGFEFRFPELEAALRHLLRV